MISFVTVSHESLLDFISKANERIIIAKSAFSEKEVKSLLDIIKKTNIVCRIFIESGDTSTRYGFGETKAIKLLIDNFSFFEVQTVERIRLSVVIVDDVVLMYAPDILFMEEETKELSFPNGITISDKALTNEIYRMITGKNDTEKIEVTSKELTKKAKNKIIEFPGYAIDNKKNNEVREDLVNSLKALEQNPQIDPAKLNEINVYRNNYKLVKIQLVGFNIKNKSINLNPFRKYLKDRKKHLKQSWSIFDSEDVKEVENLNVLKNEVDILIKYYLVDAGRFGYIISTNVKKVFLEKIIKIQTDFDNFMEGNEDGKDKNIFYQKCNEGNSKSQISSLLDESRENLKIELISIGKSDKDFIDKILEKDRHLKTRIDKNMLDRESAIEEFIDAFIYNELKFPTASEILDRVDIKVDFYDISDELLNDNKDFLKVIEDTDLEFRENNKAYVVSKE